MTKSVPSELFEPVDICFDPWRTPRARGLACLCANIPAVVAASGEPFPRSLAEPSTDAVT